MNGKFSFPKKMNTPPSGADIVVKVGMAEK